MEETREQLVARYVKEARRKERRNYLWIFSAVIGVLIMIAVNDTDTPVTSLPQVYTPTDYDAYVMAKHFVEDRLKSPSTADFASIHQSTVKGIGNEWTVKSFVDSQNGFGAMLRTRYTITMTVNRGTKQWTVTALTTDP